MDIKLLLGILPDTGKYEKTRSDLFEEYERFVEFEKSEELENYLQLKQEIESEEFKNKVSEIKAQKFQDTPEYKKEQEYLGLKKSAGIKLYFKYINSGNNTWVDTYLKSDTYKEIKELEAFTGSEEYVNVKNDMSRPGKERFKETDAYTKLEAFNALKNDPQLQNYFRFSKKKGKDIYEKYYGSKEWENFESLEEFIKSSDFLTQKDKIDKKEYASSELKKQEDEYKKLNGSKEIKLFKKLYALPEAKDYIELKNSEKLENYEKIKGIVESDSFKQEKKKIEKSTFKDTPEYKKEQRLKSLQKSADHKKYTKILNSKEYKAFQELNGGEKISNFEQLEKFMGSDEFKEVKSYMLLKPVEKYKQSEEYKKEMAYNELANSENIKWFYKAQKEDRFKEIKYLDLTFEDDFNENKLDTKKWMTRYFWGDALLKDSFSLDSDNHLNTDGKNIEVNNGVLSIVTKKEELQGKAWNPQLGFIMKNFSYSSGVINTGNSFRQKYGVFEAKIKLTASKPVGHAFWLISDQILPHIDIVKYDKNVWMNNFWLNGENSVHKNMKKLKPSKYTSGYFIYTLEWKKDLLTWKVNGKVIATQTTGVPNDAMYLNFSSGIFNSKQEASNVPVKFDVDWVRCYQYKD